MFLTFSGLDGSGKSTLIGILRNELKSRGRSSTVLTMYFHVGVYPCIRFARDKLSQAVSRLTGKEIKSELITTDPDRIGLRQARHGKIMGMAYAVVRSSLAKKFIYCADLAMFILLRAYFEGMKGRIVIMDRYFYDMLADVADGVHWNFIDAFLSVLPRPVAPFFIDVDPGVALKRKGEYSLSYLRKRRTKYMRIFERVPGAIILANDSLENARDKMIKEAFARMELK